MAVNRLKVWSGAKLEWLPIAILDLHHYIVRQEYQVLHGKKSDTYLLQ